MAFDPVLAERVREALAPVPVREVKMFGGLSFLVAEKMVVSVRGHTSRRGNNRPYVWARDPVMAPPMESPRPGP